LEITKTKTVLSLMLVLITILTTLTLTTTISAYAGDDDNGGDGNKQKAEDDSAAAIDDCDDNDVERAGFDCIDIATNDVEIETAEEESTILSVCKVVIDTFGVASEDDFQFTVTGNNPEPDEFEGDPNCVDVTIGPGEYTVSEINTGPAGENHLTRIEEGSDCVQDPLIAQRATGEIQAGETQECTFINEIVL
jgi:hypothetical protein